MATKEKETNVPEEGTFKVKKKARNLGKKSPTVTKVDLTPKKEETKTDPNAVQKSEPKKDVQPAVEQSQEKRPETKVELQEVGSPHSEKPDTPKEDKEEVTVIKEVKKPKAEEIKTPQAKEPVINMPENIQKLVNFMNET